MEMKEYKTPELEVIKLSVKNAVLISTSGEEPGRDDEYTPGE